MRPQVLLLALAIFAVVAALPLAQGQGWPCCDKCGTCTKSQPPQCLCSDVSPTDCNSDCKSCVKTTGGFRCADRIVNFCEHRCTPAA